MEEDYEEKKQKNHLDLLPRSTMSLDSVKRAYNDHKKTDKKYFGTKEFSDGFDAGGFSVYKSEYKFNKDFKGTADFMKCNTVSGFIQEIDGRKYAFGSLNLVKEEDDFKLHGYWIIRGKEPCKEIFAEFLGDNDWTEVATFDYEKLDEVFYGEVFFRSVFL